MTEEIFKRLRNVREREASGREYLKLAIKQATPRQRISVLQGNASELISDTTYQKCWNLMKADAENKLDELKKEFDEA